MESFLLFAALVLLVGLIGLMIYESRQLRQYKETMELFIESNSEIFGVVNVNANVLREAGERIVNLEKFAELAKAIVDAHAHALKIYAPDWNVLKDPLPDQVQNLKNFSEENLRTF